jgi:hypothetical protein
VTGHVYDPDPDGFCRFCQGQAADCTGRKHARSRPAPPEGDTATPKVAKGAGTRHQSPSQSSATFGTTVIRLADVEPERVRWLWPGYLPLGKLVVLDGDPDQGKSAITVDWAAKISTGSPMPDGAEPVKGATLILSAEDGLADTIRPRLDAAGGDPARVITITEMFTVTEGERITRPVAIPGDLPAIENTIRRNGVVLVIVDVLMAYLDGSVDSYRDQDVRRALFPLAAMADRTGCCIVAIRHFTKSGARAIHRGGGSVGIGGAARAGFMVATDPDDDSGHTHVLAPVKCNLAEHPPALAYRLDADEERGCVKVTWLGESRQTADALLADNGSEEERSERDEAAEWLTGYLIDHGGEDGAGDIIKAASKVGIAQHTLQRSRSKAGVTTAKSGMRGGWLWRLDPSEGDTKVTKMTGAVDLSPSSPSSPSVTFAGQDAEPDDGPEPPF